MDLSDIDIEATMEQKVLNISLIILIEKISKLIRSLLNKKALKPNGIPNEVFKTVVLVIVKDLVKAASYCFVNKTIPKNFKKKSITVILHKEKKTILF